MRLLKRNLRPLWVANVDMAQTTPMVDEYGNETGEWGVVYSTPVKVYGNVGMIQGAAANEFFGLNLQYDRTVVLDSLPDGFDEGSVMWINQTDTTKPHDYVVRRIGTDTPPYVVAISRVNLRA